MTFRRWLISMGKKETRTPACAPPMAFPRRLFYISIHLTLSVMRPRFAKDTILRNGTRSFSLIITGCFILFHFFPLSFQRRKKKHGRRDDFTECFRSDARHTLLCYTSDISDNEWITYIYMYIYSSAGLFRARRCVNWIQEEQFNGGARIYNSFVDTLTRLSKRGGGNVRRKKNATIFLISL